MPGHQSECVSLHRRRGMFRAPQRWRTALHAKVHDYDPLVTSGMNVRWFVVIHVNHDLEPILS